MERPLATTLDLSHDRGEALAVPSRNPNDIVADGCELVRDPETQSPAGASHDNVRHEIGLTCRRQQPLGTARNKLRPESCAGLTRPDKPRGSGSLASRYRRSWPP